MRGETILGRQSETNASEYEWGSSSFQASNRCFTPSNVEKSSTTSAMIWRAWLSISERDFPRFAFGQFHQHFMYKFFVQTSFWQLFSSYMYVEKAAEMMFVQKIRT